VGLVFAQNWPGWRGDGRGISPEKNLPLKWGEDEGATWKMSIPGTGHSSPIVWGNRVFVTTAVAECYIVKPGPEFEILAVNKLDEVFCASPAVSAGRLFLRGRKHLYCIGK
jgi:hypothetical protein